jgi:hypothetical protein
VIAGKLPDKSGLAAARRHDGAPQRRQNCTKVINDRQRKRARHDGPIGRKKTA